MEIDIVVKKILREVGIANTDFVKKFKNEDRPPFCFGMRDDELPDCEIGTCPFSVECKIIKDSIFENNNVNLFSMVENRVKALMNDDLGSEKEAIKTMTDELIRLKGLLKIDKKENKKMIDEDEFGDFLPVNENEVKTDEVDEFGDTAKAEDVIEVQDEVEEIKPKMTTKKEVKQEIKVEPIKEVVKQDCCNTITTESINKCIDYFFNCLSNFLETKLKVSLDLGQDIEIEETKVDTVEKLEKAEEVLKDVKEETSKTKIDYETVNEIAKINANEDDLKLLEEKVKKDISKRERGFKLDRIAGRLYADPIQVEKILKKLVEAGKLEYNNKNECYKAK